MKMRRVQRARSAETDYRPRRRLSRASSSDNEERGEEEERSRPRVKSGISSYFYLRRSGGECSDTRSVIRQSSNPKSGQSSQSKSGHGQSSKTKALQSSNPKSG